MLKIRNLYKEKDNKMINDIDINIDKGDSISIECSNETSDLLINIIIGKEVKAKGEIYIDQVRCNKINYKKVGVILREDYFYEYMSVEEYMKFFSDISGNNVDYKESLLNFALLDVKDIKIKKLNYSQKRRLSFAREMLKNPKLLILQEPILHIDDYSRRIILENINTLKGNEVSFLSTSILIKDVLLLGDKVYSLNEDGLIDLEGDKDEKKEEFEKAPIYKIEKISAKKEDSILLFDPVEIDYIESENSVSILNIKGEKFPTTYSLLELEKKLESFGFFRCHRSYIVNLQRVREVITFTRNSYSLSLDDKKKSTLPLSKGRLENLKNILDL